jgi:SAM-dependent MidA family methyltransferase
MSRLPTTPAAPPAIDASETSRELARHIAGQIHREGGWIGFERYMALALYTPGLGYYARDSRKFGAMPASGSDFITAPELSPLFARALARQLAQALTVTGTREVWEFGAGSGVLAAGLLAELGDAIDRYTIVDLSASLRERQRASVDKLAPAQAHKLAFADSWPEHIDGVVVGNELLDAMPVLLLHHDGVAWRERGVALAGGSGAGELAPAGGERAPADGGDSAGTPGDPVGSAVTFAWADRPIDQAPPLLGDLTPDEAAAAAGWLTEVGRQGCAFVTSLAQRLRHGAAFFIDYGFPEAEYYHPQRSGGTLVCHRAHLVETDPAALLTHVGDKDITAHVDFTAIALAGQDAGLEVLGYTSQARFLFNCGLLVDLGELQQRGDYAGLARAQKLVAEHEMGELFKVIGLAAPGSDFGADGALGFTQGDRSHRL